MGINKQIETSIAYLLIEDDILFIKLKQDADLDKENVLEMIEARNLIQDGVPYLVLADVRKIWQANNEARKTAASEPMRKLNKAMAILTGSLASKMLANFFIQFNKPKTPTRMFTSEEKAIEWLKNYK